MKKNNHILLVFDNIKELALVENNLVENGFEVLKSENLKEALTTAQSTIPALIVVNTLNAENDIEIFGKQVKMKYLKKVILPSSIDLEDYLTVETREHLVINTLMRNKIHRDNKVVFFISQKKFTTP